MAPGNGKEERATSDLAFLSWFASSLRQPASVVVPAGPANPQAKPRVLRVRVERNFPFEFLQASLQRGLALWDASAQVSLSGYDIAHPSSGAREQVDATVFWVDWRLFAFERDDGPSQQAIEWIVARCRSAVALSKSPVFINSWSHGSSRSDSWRLLRQALDTLAQGHANVHVLELDAVLDPDGESFWYDPRNDAVGKFPFSAQATTQIANHLAVSMMSRVFGREVRAIVLDADDTLYQGTLAEDGVAGVSLTAGHRRFQQTLRELQSKGILLTMLSRNVAEDVKQLFTERHDFPLRWEDFAYTHVNWLPKAEGLRSTLDILNVSPAHVCVVDDNAVELLKLGDISEVVRLLASADGAETERSVRRLPGVWSDQRFRSTLGAERTLDIQANVTRRALHQHFDDPKDMLRQLQTHVVFARNQKQHWSRVVELSQKTNQFNLSLSRLDAQDLDYHAERQGHVVTVQVQDKLGDSGIVGMALLSLRRQILYIDEWCLSCRALGRSVEDIWLVDALQWAHRHGAQHVAVRLTNGPRNQPALKWAQKRGLSLRKTPIEKIIGAMVKETQEIPITTNGGFT